MNDNIFKLNNIVFRWNSNSPFIFNNISLSLKRSRFTIILGKNGSGKSTLLKLIASLIRPINGSILFENKNIVSIDRREYARNVSFLSQEQSNIPLQVKDIVALGNFVRYSFGKLTTYEENAKTNEALKIFKIEELAQKEYNKLSGGEKQKVMLARAFCQSDKVMLLDEPTSSLDIGNKIEIMAFLKRLQTKKGTTVIAITHDFNLAWKYADDIVLIGRESLLYGEKKEILTQDNLCHFFDASIKIIAENERLIFYY